MQETPTDQPLAPVDSTSQVSPQPRQSYLKKIAITVGSLLVLAGAAYGGYYYGRQSVSTGPENTGALTPEMPSVPETAGCTYEAKICPDGSTVGRSGPKCEFEACPGEEAQEEMYNYSNQELSFSYPTAWYLYKGTSYPRFYLEEESLISSSVPIFMVDKVADSSMEMVNKYFIEEVGTKYEANSGLIEEKVADILIDDFPAVMVSRTIDPSIDTDLIASYSVYVNRDSELFEFRMNDGSMQGLNKINDIIATVDFK